MFKIGDKVVHQRHGAGVVLQRRKLTIGGTEREYFCVQIEHGLSTLMIPVDQVENGELRPASVDREQIEEILLQLPQSLESDYKLRQEKVSEDLKTMQPQRLAEALRDLSWLEKTDKLTSRDSQLRDRVVKALAEELALRPNSNLETAKSWLQECVDSSMRYHLENKVEAEVVLD